MKNIILKTENLNKKFGKYEAVKNVSLKIYENTVYGLLGPNGAGKSTTLKMISGLFGKTYGEIMFKGHPWSRKDLSDIGSLIENPPLYDNLTAYENLKVRTMVLGLPDERIKEVIGIVGLGETESKKAGQFSMGMKQRLGIACAILNNPKLLILDEPANGLDPVGIKELRTLIRSFPQHGITVIVSSHNLPEIVQVADYIGIISNGILGYQSKIEENTDLEELFMKTVEETSCGGLK